MRPKNINVSPHNPGRPAWLEEVIQPLYHRLPYGAGAITAQRFFTNPGAVTPVDITPQLSASNGQIPTPKLFVAHGIRVVLDQAATLADRLEDALTFVWNTSVQFFIGERTYLWAPTWLVPSGKVGVDLASDQGGIVAAADRVVASSGGGGYYDRLSFQRIPTTIPSTQLFYVEIAPDTAAAPTLTSARNVTVVLDGALGREL
jgi:predicted alternative tryptophan synthase beta-subunit